MVRCFVCTHLSYLRSSRYISDKTKEVYWLCQNVE
ncbi:ogr/Delta-like zinc finger family protein [Edaphovirga cremea]|nr:ogr/Delta-like zinc finger family protein [Edaphovirga cremea]